ncbi:AraC family transcriptional regulator [Croceicoccus mobilis]|uniref:AraC family transcriptional regulator n=1 Tax=Croceicoccus mobilis TaxID=1703339 RepID=A0A916Z7K4_9SPHN|nr:AraC family transcriptional regulator [Croceicoccus mobilis]GGD80460.1 AraC family transcriptional regulator [Croceicoccus mobilis]
MHKPAKIRAYSRRLDLAGETQDAVFAGVPLDSGAIDRLSPLDDVSAARMFSALGRHTPGNFALKCGTRAKLSDLGVAGKRMMFLPDLRTVMEYWTGATRLAGAPFDATFRHDGQHWYYEQDSALPFDASGYRFCAEASISSMIELWLQLADRVPTLLTLEVPFAAPDERNAYSELGYQKIVYDADRFRMIGDARELDLPVMSSELGHAFAIDPAAHRKTRARLIDLFEQSERLPTLDEACERLAMSRTTLHRRLQEENCSYRELQMEFRRAYVDCALAEGVTPKRMSWRLGYEDVASFRRAVRRWHDGAGLRDLRRGEGAMTIGGTR